MYCDETSTITHMYLALRSQEHRDKLYASILDRPELKLDKLEPEVMTLQWQNGIISNYDYLMYINR